MEFISEREAIRQAMLKAQSKWLEHADNADTVVTRTLARTIADTFGQEAEEYKTTTAKEAPGAEPFWTRDVDGREASGVHFSS